MTTYTIVDRTALGGDCQDIHKHNCQDAVRAAAKVRRNYGSMYAEWAVRDEEFGSLREAVDGTYGPECGGFYEEAGYVPGTPEYENAWRDYTGEFRIMPCVTDLPTE